MVVWYSDHHVNTGLVIKWFNIQMAFNYQTVRQSDNFQPFEYHISLVFRSPHVISLLNTLFIQWGLVQFSNCYVSFWMVTKNVSNPIWHLDAFGKHKQILLGPVFDWHRNTGQQQVQYSAESGLQVCQFLDPHCMFNHKSLSSCFISILISS